MSVFYRTLRILTQLLMVLIYGKYLEKVISWPFLVGSFLMMSVITLIFSKTRLRTVPALILFFLLPWGVRTVIAGIQFFDRSFLLIAFDRSFLFSLLPVYSAALTGWLTARFPRTGKYEVLLNGILLFFLFYSQGNYRISLVSEPFWLALGTVAFLLMELLQLYLSVILERGIDRSPGRTAAELALFFFTLLPLIIYLLLPLWKEYEEGSVTGGGGLLKSTLFRFDFSDYIKLETEISMSDELVLMYRKEGPAERMLLRRFVLSGYKKGAGFFRVDEDKKETPDTVPPRYREYTVPPYRNREKVNQELFLINIDPTAFLSLNSPINIQPIYNWDNSSFTRIYRTDALVNTVPIREFDPSINMDAEDLKHYTDTDGEEKISELADEITEKIPGSYLKVLAIERYLQKNYYYSLKPGVATDGDQLSWFLFNSKKGYCSYFAFSMALMCRSLGIPARVAVGFWVDPDMSVLNFYPVRADQAHAWVEVYFSDYGWIDFDPTSTTLYPGEQYPFAGFSVEEISPLIEEILDNDMVPENLAQTDTASDENLKGPRLITIFFRTVSDYWYLIISVFWILFIIAHHYAYVLLGVIRRTARGKAICLYGDARMKLSFERKPNRESLADYAGRIEKLYDISFIPLTGFYQKSLFSHRFSTGDLQEMKNIYRETIDQYRRNISLRKRAVHFFFPFVRSLHL